MKIIFEYYRKSKRRWKYKAVEIDNKPASNMQKKHTELILYKNITEWNHPPKLIEVTVHGK